MHIQKTHRIFVSEIKQATRRTRETPKTPTAMKKVHSYSYKPEWLKKGRDTRTFGVEIEYYPAKNMTREDVLENLQKFEADQGFKRDELFVIKTDGSLNERYDGLELVTHPFNLKYMQRRRIFANLQDTGMRSFKYKTCGLHVHASREGLKKSTIAKLLFFFADNPEFINFLGQRDYNQYCRQMLKGRIIEELNNQNNPTGYYGSYGYGQRRYNSINLQNNHTIEFRFFQGNSKDEGVYRAVEICDALLNYAAQTTTPQLSVKGFTKFAQTQKREETRTSRSYKYPYLRMFLRNSEYKLS